MTPDGTSKAAVHCDYTSEFVNFVFTLRHVCVSTVGNRDVVVNRRGLEEVVGVLDHTSFPNGFIGLC